jgi:hypothetical protein
MTKPTLDDLTRALTAEVVRRAASLLEMTCQRIDLAVYWNALTTRHARLLSEGDAFQDEIAPCDLREHGDSTWLLLQVWQKRINC